MGNDHRTDNQRILDQFLGVRDDNGGGDAKDQQNKGLDAWKQASSYVATAIDGSSNAPIQGGNVQQALTTLLAGWTSPSADEFKNQVGKLVTFGGQLSNTMN